MEDPKNGRGDPKNGEGVEMNLEIFLEGGFIIMLDKISRDTQNWGWSKLFRKKNTSPLGIFGTFPITSVQSVEITLCVYKVESNIFKHLLLFINKLLFSSN